MITMQLMPHQEKAIRELRSGSILCADVGTGKSITALAYYFQKICGGVMWTGGGIGPQMYPRDLYIITTARKRDTGEWESELKRFGFEKGGENEIEYKIDSWNNLEKYIKVYGAFFIFDEQRVVGKGKWVKAFYKIARRNQWILLTATPGDTWLDYIPVFVANGFYKNRSEFLSQHAVYNPYITKFPKIDRFTGIGLLEKHRKEITVRMKFEKHTKRHWQEIRIDYDKDIYKKVMKDRWDPWKDEPIKDIAGCCQLLRRAANSRVTGSADHKDFDLDSRAMEIYHLCCKKHPKLIVFYNYNYELAAMKECFEYCQNELNCYSGMKRFAVAEWNGHKHEPLPKTERWIYLVQYSAGAEGWNCIETDAMAFYSLSYSYKAMEQASGRIDRLNTPFEDLYYYYIVSDAPIDKAVEKAIRSKKDFNEHKYWRIIGVEEM